MITVDFDKTGQLLIIYFALVKYLKRRVNTLREFIS